LKVKCFETATSQSTLTLAEILKNYIMKAKLLLISIALIFSNKIKAQDVSQTERNSLIEFYNQMDGANWQNKTNWNTTQPVSTWYGITVQN
ncbi:hypothetical protein, partial [Escherichia coli]|uniref:hypothetical protein n=1 Tax=Escherichia coli TaxID=562 RepID=UPI00215A5890